MTPQSGHRRSQDRPITKNVALSSVAPDQMQPHKQIIIANRRGGACHRVGHVLVPRCFASNSWVGVDWVCWTGFGDHDILITVTKDICLMGPRFSFYPAITNSLISWHGWLLFRNQWDIDKYGTNCSDLSG